jgi:hypothetical protein
MLFVGVRIEQVDKKYTNYFNELPHSPSSVVGDTKQDKQQS